MTIKQCEKIAKTSEKWRTLYLAGGLSALPGVTAALRENPHKKGVMERAIGAAAAAAELTLGLRPYHVQLMAAAALCLGTVAEMNTGEGKTLTATMPAYYHSLFGEGVHVATVNEYLAARDRDWMSPVYEALGMRPGLVLAGQEREEKQAAYKSDITYSTATELGFDYLRDGIVVNAAHRVQRVLARVIVDEADSILLDEAVTPMILSGAGDQDARACLQADQFAKYLKPALFANFDEDAEVDEVDADYIADEHKHAVYLCPEGIRKAEQYYRTPHLFDAANTEIYHRILEALKAHGLMRRDVDYIVADGKVRIVDQHTGRVMEGRRFSGGLHQAIEAKERVEIHPESNTLATITYQNYFRLYGSMAGMTGTAYAARQEFSEVYGKSVIRIPPNKPCIRLSREDVLCNNGADKLEQLTLLAAAEHAKGRPLLIGTASVEMSEAVSGRLAFINIPHMVLNAKQHVKEAEIVKDAGRSFAVTVATNMAGRGTDILLGAGDDGDAAQVRALGGLLILGTERHHSRRVDEQLAGRAGRQGDPGESVFFIAPDDELFRLHGEEGMKLTKKSVRRAQAMAETGTANMRKRALETDEVVQNQRQQMLRYRELALTGEDLGRYSRAMIEDAVRFFGKKHLPDEIEDRKDSADFRIALHRLFGNLLAPSPGEERGAWIAAYTKAALAAYEERALRLAPVWGRLERAVLLESIDRGWCAHLEALEELRRDRPMAEKGAASPISVFVKNSYRLFDETNAAIRESYLFGLFHAALRGPEGIV